MPPAIPLHAFDFKGKSRSGGVTATRAGTFFAELALPQRVRGFTRRDLLEFGNTVYGPERASIHEGKADLAALAAGMESGPSGLRRVIAKLAPLGGTRSHPHPDTRPVLSSALEIRIEIASTSCIEIHGIRRPHVFAAVPSNAPRLIMMRILDVLTDLLSCSVDSRLDIRPPLPLLLATVKHALSRESGQCAVSDSHLEMYAKPLAEAMLEVTPWDALSKLVPGTDDEEVITGFIRQFLDRARQADIHGENKLARQMKKEKKEKKERKKSLRTVFVNNVPWESTEAELHAVFSQGIESIPNGIYKVMIPKDPESKLSKGFALVVCRSRKATEMVLEKTGWEIGGRALQVRWRDPHSDIAQPAAKRQRSERLPPEVEEAMVRAITQNPGCNVSQIPNLILNGKGGDSPLANPQVYGFKNLTHALQSIPSIYLESGSNRNFKRPAFFAYPK